MIIVKSSLSNLTPEDIESNLDSDFIDEKSHNINLVYVEMETNTLNEVPCFTSYNYLKEMVEWLNSNNYPALIWIYDVELLRYEMPFFIHNNLCCAYEGFLKLTAEKFHQAMIDIAAQFKNLDNFLNPAMVWMVEKLTTYKDSMVFMNNKGEFTYINTHSRYIDNKNTYMIYEVPYKPSKFLTHGNFSQQVHKNPTEVLSKHGPPILEKKIGYDAHIEI